MLLTNELERVILRNDDVGIAYVKTTFLWEDWVYLSGIENQVNGVTDDIQSSSMTKDPEISD